MAEPASMGEPAFAEKACDLAMCKCNAAAPGCPTPQQGCKRRTEGMHAMKAFDIANNSLHEVVGAVDPAEAIGALDEGVAQESSRSQFASSA